MPINSLSIRWATPFQHISTVIIKIVSRQYKRPTNLQFHIINDEILQSEEIYNIVVDCFQRECSGRFSFFLFRRTYWISITLVKTS